MATLTKRAYECLERQKVDMGNRIDALEKALLDFVSVHPELPSLKLLDHQVRAFAHFEATNEAFGVDQALHICDDTILTAKFAEICQQFYDLKRFTVIFENPMYKGEKRRVHCYEGVDKTLESIVCVVNKTFSIEHPELYLSASRYELVHAYRNKNAIVTNGNYKALSSYKLQKKAEGDDNDDVMEAVNQVDATTELLANASLSE